MNTGQARDLYQKYSTAMAYVTVESADGTPGIGSAFHVGEGVFVTARHVVEGKRITEIGSTEHTYIRLETHDPEEPRTTVHLGDEEFPAHQVRNGIMELARGPVFHSNPEIEAIIYYTNQVNIRPPRGGPSSSFRSPFVLSPPLSLLFRYCAEEQPACRNWLSAVYLRASAVSLALCCSFVAFLSYH